MNLVHDSPVRGHRWFKRTLQRCGETFRWKEMRFDIEAYIKECEWYTVYTHNGHENDTTGLSPYQMVFCTATRTVEGVFMGSNQRPGT